jgi:hypothetical protein
MDCKDAAADILWTHLTDATPPVSVSAAWGSRSAPFCNRSQMRRSCDAVRNPGGSRTILDLVPEVVCPVSMPKDAHGDEVVLPVRVGEGN